MSRSKNNLRNTIKKAMVSTSMAAAFMPLMLSGESAFGDTLLNVQVQADNANLGTGAGLIPNAPFNSTNSLLTIPGPFTNITVPNTIPSIISMYLTDPGATMFFQGSIKLGSIVPPNLNQADTSLNMFIQNGSTVTLNGTAPSLTDAQNATNQTGVPASSPFAPGLNNTVPSDTYFINSIDFGDNGTLTIDTTTGDNGEIAFNSTTTDTKVANAANATFNIVTGMQVRNTTWSTIGNTNISDNTTYSFIVNDTTDVNVQQVGAKLNFLGPNATFNASCEIGNINTPVTFISNAPILSGIDGVGITAFRASTGPTTVKVDVGILHTQRLKDFTIYGGNTATIASSINAQTINISLSPNPAILLPGATQFVWQTPIDTSDGNGNNGLIQFTDSTIAEFQANIISDMDFASTSSTAIIDDGVNVTGSINNSGAVAPNVLQFQGNSTVSGDIGTTTPTNTIVINGAATTKTTLQNVTTNTLLFGNDGFAYINGTLTAKIGVDFNNTEGIMD